MSTEARAVVDAVLADFDSPTVWPVINHNRKHSHHIDIWNEFNWNDHGILEGVMEWRWQLRAGNGQIISRSSDGYHDRRDLVHGLELATGMLMLDQERNLNGPAWALYGVRLAYDDWLGAGQQGTRFVEGVVIPVRVPEGSGSWASRRQR